MDELLRLTALELGAAIRRGEVSIPEVTRLALERAQADPCNAFITLTPERAMARARHLQAGLGSARSPLYGVPMAFKDNICVQGVKTSCASRILGDFKPPYEATVCAQLHEAGAVPIGKTNMDEFAMGSTTETSCWGPTRNPWSPDRVPGGSSGGSAAAVAGRCCWFALGSDTGGSIRQPAAYCAVTGMKPTYGTVSRYGLIAYASSLDQIGPLARDAADCAAILDAIQLQDRRDSTSIPLPERGRLLRGLTGDLRGIRVGLPADCFGAGLDGEVRAAVLAAAKVLEGRGAQLEELSFPVMKYGVPAYYIIACAEASSNLSRYDGVKYGWRAESYDGLTGLYCNTRTQGFGAEAKRRILLGTFVLSAGYYDAYYRKALQVKALIKDAYDRAFERFDLLLTPVAPTAAPRLGESLSDPLKMYLSDVYTVPVNLAGLPGLSMPCGFDRDGLPIGAQLIGPRLGDALVLRAAHAFQLDTGYHKRAPAAREGGDGV